MEHLAVVPLAPSGSLRRSVDLLNRRSTGGGLVVIVADASDDDLRAAAHLRSRYGSLTIVHIDRSAWDPSAPIGRPPALPALRVTREAPFADVWNAFARRGPGRGRVRAPLSVVAP